VVLVLVVEVVGVVAAGGVGQVGLPGGTVIRTGGHLLRMRSSSTDR